MYSSSSSQQLNSKQNKWNNYEFSEEILKRKKGNLIHKRTPIIILETKKNRKERLKMSKEIKKDLNDDEQPTKIYPVLETTIPIPSTIPSAQNGVPQAAVRYINHSRNASSVSRNSRNAVTFAVQPPNKPDAVDSLLKIIGLRSNYEKSKETKICFVRITSTGQFKKNIYFSIASFIREYFRH